MSKIMYLRKRIRLKPTPEQEILFRKSAGEARWTYNYYISANQENYRRFEENGRQGKQVLTAIDVRNQITHEVKPLPEYAWLKDVSSKVIDQACRDGYDALKRFFAGTSKFPNFKSKRKSKQSFYLRSEYLKNVPGGFKGEKLGLVKTAEPLPKLLDGTHYCNPRIIFDGKYWYLSVSYAVEIQEEELTEESLGIDLGIKDLAICSNGLTFPNINKTEKVKKLEKKLKREERKLSRMMEANILYRDENRKPVFKRPLDECRNFQKQKKKVRLVHRRLANIRHNYTHQVTTSLVKTKPAVVKMETLNLAGLMKNRHVARHLRGQKLAEFKRQMEYKCEKYGIEFVSVPAFYPSSKTCSRCGAIKSDLQWKDRTYVCDHCGLIMDRDQNASLNLAHYPKE